MVRFVCLFAVAISFQVSSGEARGPPGGGFNTFRDNLPEKCRGPPPDIEKPQECCELPPLFSEEELESCGFVKSEVEKPKDTPGFHDCTRQQCLLEKKGFFDGTNIDYKAIEGYLDTYVSDNPSSQPAVEAGRKACMGEGGPPGPPEMCEANRLMFCMGFTMFTNCPADNWKQTEKCQALKTHIEDCPPPLRK